MRDLHQIFRKAWKFSLGFLVLLSIVAATLSFFQTTTYAADASKFQAGNIISDTIFADKRTMTASQIQSFLNSKVSRCDSNGAQPSEKNNSGVPDYNHDGTIQRWEWAKKYYNQTTFTCLKDYKENDKSAAQIIYDASQEFTINPQVLITLLQKEQSLVTDTWPLNLQYRSATGYGCPDTAPCDSDYYGLTNQVRWAARMFRAILNGSETWYTPYELGNNRIYWNPETSCGYSTVNIANRATQALYNYTPYRPNQAALNAGYGMGDSCSSYGNRNFFLYFTDWFGSTLDSPFFRVGSSDDVFIEGANNSYYHVSSYAQMRDFGYGSRFAFVKSVNATFKSNRTNAGELSPIARFVSNGAIYAISNGILYQFPSRTVLETYGFSIGDESFLDNDKWKAAYPTGAQIETILKLSDGDPIYSIESGKKRHISSATAYNTVGSPVYSSRPNSTLSSTFAAHIPDGTPIFSNGTLLKIGSDYAIFDSGSIQPISSALMQETGLPTHYTTSWDAVSAISRVNSTIGKLVQDPSDNRFVINRGQRFAAPTGMAGTFVTVPNSFLNLIPTISTSDPLLLRINGSAKVYLMNTNRLYHIYSATDLSWMGYSANTILDATSETANLFTQTNASILANGRMFRVNNGSMVYIVDGSLKKRAIPTKGIFDQYRLSMRDVVNVDTATSNNHETLTPLSYFVGNGTGSVWALDRGMKYAMSSGTVNHYQINTDALYQTTVVNTIPSGSTSLGRLIRDIATGKVYLVESGQKHWFSTRQAFDSRGYSMSDVTNLSSDFINSLPSGSSLN